MANVRKECTGHRQAYRYVICSRCGHVSSLGVHNPTCPGCGCDHVPWDGEGSAELICNACAADLRAAPLQPEARFEGILQEAAAHRSAAHWKRAA